jgi:hypothetical protein
MVMVVSYFLMLLLFFTADRYIVIPHVLGTVIAPLVFIYLISYVFRYCAFHRMFIHYYAFIQLLNVIGHYNWLPTDGETTTLIHDSVTIVFIISATIMYVIKFRKAQCTRLVDRLIEALVK